MFLSSPTIWLSVHQDLYLQCSMRDYWNFKCEYWSSGCLLLIDRWGKCKTGCRRRRKKFKRRKKSTKRRCRRLISTILNTWRIWPRCSKSVKRWRRNGYSSSKRSYSAFINAWIYLRIRCKCNVLSMTWFHCIYEKTRVDVVFYSGVLVNCTIIFSTFSLWINELILILINVLINILRLIWINGIKYWFFICYTFNLSKKKNLFIEDYILVSLSWLTDWLICKICTVSWPQVAFI